MYIRELKVDGYGALHGLNLELDAAVNVIYGPNEAGKSTLLRFVRSMLYGFPNRKDMVERGEPMSGGRHGGRIVISDEAGESWLLERYAERGGEITLRDGVGAVRVLGQAEWERWMLGGISERLFRQLFSVSLNELHELRTLQGEEIGNYLYNAGLAGGSSLSAARRQVGSEMDRLFRPKGTTQEMNRLLISMKEIETEIRSSRDAVRQYGEAREGLEQVELELSSLESGFPELRLQAAKLQSAYDLREWWLKREALLEADAGLRRSLPDPSAQLLAEGTAQIWSEMKSKRDEAKTKLSVEQSALQDLRSRRELLDWDERRVIALPEAERLEALREVVTAKREERSELEAERRTLDETVQATLSRISAEWGEAELQAFGGLAAEREQVRKLQQAWEETERGTMSYHAELRKLERQKEVLRSEESYSISGNLNEGDQAGSVTSREALSADDYFVPRTKPALLQAWHRAEDARRNYDRARTSVRPSRTTANSRGTSDDKARGSALLFLIAGLLGAAAIAIFFFLSGSNGVETSMAYGVFGGLLLLSALVVFLAFSSSSSSSRSGSRTRSRATSSAEEGQSNPSADYNVNLQLYRKQFNESLRQLMNDPQSAATSLIQENSDYAPLDIQEHSEMEDTVWQKLREAVHERLEQLEEVERGESKRQELRNRMHELQVEKDLVERDSEELGRQADALHASWRNWLEVRKLPLHLAPDNLPELLGMAEQGQAALRQRQRVTERSDTLSHAIKEFEQAASRLMETCPPPVGLGSEIGRAVQWIYGDSVKHLARKEEAGHLERELAGADAAVRSAGAELETAAYRIERLLQEAGGATEAELEHRLRIDQRSAEIRLEAREIQLRLESGRDSESRDQLYALLQQHDEASLFTLLSDRKAVLAQEEERRSGLLDRRGRLTQELERLRVESELEDKRQRLLELQSKLELLSERYAILAISDKLIARTKAVYEEERQPEVLRRASRYFKQMTNGAYCRIIAPGDTKALLAETEDRRVLDSIFLSRGTQEQLYLSMRFALCAAASPDHPLPLLLDDLFVHFDESRLIQSLPILQDLAKERQVILFTCHRHVARTIAEGIPTARAVTLGE
ncbi:AAA family ATPase [Cohnella lupini]|uniref:AAA domain-containing protein n=1 Tax=Cohnella lupini TaxID=1294267 RepID=A0A3D9I3A8_9BACL|nr:AAA family ATPase [Cohnella lupini]RED56247.1 AAA domain-containing protein [Cohnella lupini]